MLWAVFTLTLSADDCPSYDWQSQSAIFTTDSNLQRDLLPRSSEEPEIRSRQPFAVYSPGGSPLGGSHDYLGRVIANRGNHVEVELHSPLGPGTTVELCDRGMLREHATVETVRTRGGTARGTAHEGETVRVDGRFRATVGALVRLGRLDASAAG